MQPARAAAGKVSPRSERHSLAVNLSLRKGHFAYECYAQEKKYEMLPEEPMQRNHATALK